jgi:lipopolysaccharide transport system permease protein
MSSSDLFKPLGATPPEPDLPVTIYTPESPLRHPSAFLHGMLTDIWKGRELAWRLFVRDLSAQYRQTYLGYLWAFLPPLVTALTFIFLQSQGIVNVDGVGMPYPAFAMIGTLLWQTFVEAIQGPIASVSAARPMLAKINFPREAIVMSGLYMVLFSFLIRLFLIAAVMLVWQLTPGPALPLFPIAMAGLLACGLALGLLLLPVGALYGDVGRAIPIIAQFLMLLTPVIYPARTTGLAGLLTTFNPVSPVLVTARESLTNAPLTMVPACLIVTAASLALCFLGIAAFRLVMPLLIERMGG